MLKGKTFVQLSREERSKIEVLLHLGYSYSKIASLLNRSVSTISREVKRNSLKSYSSSVASVLASKRHKEKREATVFNLDMKKFISQKLMGQRLSPELICHEGRKLMPHFISHECIYQWIWQMKFSKKGSDRPYQHLYHYLRHACRKQKRGNRRSKRGNILERRWIDERPQAASLRQRTGDLECDIMLGKDRKPGLLVALDRRSRRAWIRKLKTKNASVVARLLKSICARCSAVRTLTFDNDQSFAEHYRLHPLGIKTFFTHPYSSQEKGSVENRIGLIRMFFPKGTDFAKVTSKEVKKVENLINNRPMRMFQYRSPNEIY